MATSVNEGKAKVKESYGDLLTCTICLETFKVPKYLPCLHTFCETCIHTYIVSSVKEDKPETFKCPLCRRPVHIQECQGNPDSWAKQLPGNHFVVSLKDRKAVKQGEKQCTACESNNKSSKAVSWCTVCEEAYCDPCVVSHKSFKMSRAHKLVQIKDMSGENYVSLSGFVECNDHPQKTIEVYCIDHSKPCCTLCATVHHRKCEQVVTIDKALYGIKESEKARNLVKRLKEGNENLDEILQKRTQNIKTFERDTGTVLSKIETLRENIKHVKNLDENLQDELNNSKKEVTIKMNDEVTELSSLKSTFINLKNIFDACIAEGSELHCLVKMEEILENLPQVEDKVSKLSKKITHTSISFQPNNTISDVTSLGRITLKGSSMTCPKIMRKVNFHSGKVKLLFTIDVVGGSQISGIFLNGFILLSDYENRKVIKYDDKGTQIGERKITGTPSDVTKVDDMNIAVATNSAKIHLINAETLTLNKTITATVSVFGLCFVDKEYVTAHYQSKQISFLDASFKNIWTQTTSTDLYFVCCNRQNDYIYKDGNQSIKHVSSSGTCSYTTETSPYTYGIDFEDNIYVAGYTSNSIHQLTPTCELIRIIPISTFATRPSTYSWVLRFEEDSNRFC